MNEIQTYADFLRNHYLNYRIVDIENYIEGNNKMLQELRKSNNKIAEEIMKLLPYEEKKLFMKYESNVNMYNERKIDLLIKQIYRDFSNPETYKESKKKGYMEKADKIMNEVRKGKEFEDYLNRLCNMYNKIERLLPESYKSYVGECDNIAQSLYTMPVYTALEKIIEGL